MGGRHEQAAQASGRLLDDAIFTAPAFDDWGGAALIGVDGRLLGIGSLLVPDARPGRTPEAGKITSIDRYRYLKLDTSY